MDVDDNMNPISPAIIVQGGGFAVNDDRNIYQEVTENAAKEGYDILRVSVTEENVSLHYKGFDYYT